MWFASRVVLVLACFASSVRAGGFEIPEIGVRRTAMAAVIGRPDEPSALYHNPGGLVLSDHWRAYASLGFAFVHTALQLHAWDQSDRFVGAPGRDGYYPAVEPKRSLAGLPMLAASGPLGDRWYGGAALFVPNGAGAVFDDHAVTRYHLIDGYFVAAKAIVGAAYRIDDRIAIGATIGVANMRIHGHRLIYPIINGIDASTITGTAPDLVLDGSGWGPTWSIGAYGRALPTVTWGLALLGRTDATLEGPLAITYSQDAPTPGDKLIGTQTTAQFLPWTLHAGVNVDVTPQLELGSELRYWLYSQDKSEHTQVTGVFLIRSIDVPKDYNDSWEASIGGRVHALDFAPALDVMAGVHYDRAPVPSHTVTFDSPTFDNWGIHTGARYVLGRWRLGAAWEHVVFRVPNVTNSVTFPPSNLRGTGRIEIVAISAEFDL